MGSHRYVRGQLVEHGSEIQVFEGICNLFRMSRISNFSIRFALLLKNTNIRKNGYPENK